MDRQSDEIVRLLTEIRDDQRAYCAESRDSVRESRESIRESRQFIAEARRVNRRIVPLLAVLVLVAIPFVVLLAIGIWMRLFPGRL